MSDYVPSNQFDPRYPYDPIIPTDSDMEEDARMEQEMIAAAKEKRRQKEVLKLKKEVEKAERDIKTLQSLPVRPNIPIRPIVRAPTAAGIVAGALTAANCNGGGGDSAVIWRPGDARIASYAPVRYSPGLVAAATEGSFSGNDGADEQAAPESLPTEKQQSLVEKLYGVSPSQTMSRGPAQRSTGTGSRGTANRSLLQNAQQKQVTANLSVFRIPDVVSEEAGLESCMAFAGVPGKDAARLLFAGMQSGGGENGVAVARARVAQDLVPVLSAHHRTSSGTGPTHTQTPNPALHATIPILLPPLHAAIHARTAPGSPPYSPPSPASSATPKRVPSETPPYEPPECFPETPICILSNYPVPKGNTPLTLEQRITMPSYTSTQSPVSGGECESEVGYKIKGMSEANLNLSEDWDSESYESGCEGSQGGGGASEHNRRGWRVKQ